MNKRRAMIVDDSEFSVILIKEILKEMNIEVLSVANSRKETIEKFNDNKDIDLITMDITLPDGDGLEIAKELKEINPNVKVLVISSTMDEALIQKAKDYKLNGFLQKPVNKEELESKVDAFFESDQIYEKLKKFYKFAFIESMTSFFLRTTKTGINYEILDNEASMISSKGISIAIGLIGVHKGRFILDISRETAKIIAENSLHKDIIAEKDISVYINEVANIIAGNAVSLLNGMDRRFGIKISPPTTFSGNNLEIFLGYMDTASIKFITKFGDVYVNIGFQRGTSEWM